MFSAAIKSGSAGVSKDPQFNYVTMLLHGDGTNGAQNNTFLDSSTNNFTITRGGSTTQGTFTPYGSNWSNFFNGSSYFTIASNSVLNMNTYACLECWVNLSSLGANQLHVGRDSNYWLAYSFSAISGSANKFVFSIYNGSSWSAVSSTTSPTIGTWYHVAGIRSGSTLQIYINGVLETTGTLSGTATTSATPFGIADNQGSTPMNGYLSNVRVNLGSTSAVLPYTANFTPSTTPLVAVTGTQLLACQSNCFVDNSTNALTLSVGGSPSVQRFSPFIPANAYLSSVIGGSGYFNGSSDSLSTPYNSAFVLGTNDFTVECWMYLTSNSELRNIVGLGYGANGSGPVTSSWQLRYYGTQGSNQVAFNRYDGGTETNFLTSGAPIVSNSWFHIAVSRTGGTLKIFVNGIAYYSAANTFNYSAINTSDPFLIGLGYYGPQSGMGGPRYFPGFISNVRVINGTGVYSSNFTPPTAPLTAITNTSLLASTNNAAIFDNAMMNDLETVGNAQISTSVKKFGTGSIAFDSTGDGLTRPVSPLFDFGSGSFTVEFWANCVSTSGQGYFVSVWDDVGGSDANSSWLVRLNSGTILTHIMQGSGTYNTLTSSAISTNTWFHFAFVRNGTTQTMYINGTSVASASVTGAMNTVIRSLRVGYQGGSANYLNGYIDDLRITKGVARYTANFTPPTAAFPNN